MSTYGSQPNPGLQDLLRVILRTFRVGVFLGVEVRMYWLALVGMPLLFASLSAPYAEGALELLFLVAVQFFGLFVIVWTHEMGHIEMGRRYHIPTSLITLSPMGGIAHMGHGGAPTPQIDIRVALAGPAVHLLWLVPVAPLAWWLPHGLVTLPGFGFDPLWYTVQFLYYTNVGLLLFNLLPIFPLDGGRTARALLSLRWHPNRATMWVSTAGMIGGGILILLALSRAGIGSTIGIAIGIFCIMHSLRERQVAKHSLIYQTAQREPWETDPDAWKLGGFTEPERRPGPLGRWRQRRADRRHQRQAEADRALDREVDAVLSRLSEVGMSGLDKHEKAVLLRAAKRRRDVG